MRRDIQAPSSDNHQGRMVGRGAEQHADTASNQRHKERTIGKALLLHKSEENGK
jgi:hypothetical protein